MGNNMKRQLTQYNYRAELKAQSKIFKSFWNKASVMSNKKCKIILTGTLHENT